MSDAVKILQKSVKQNSRVPTGTVVTFVSGSRYLYGAVYVAGRWYVTGNGVYWGKNVFEYDEFITKVLSNADSAKVAVEWSNLDMGE